jgi:N-methylhydantoinase B
MTGPVSSVDPIRLEVFRHLFSSVAEEMGVILRRTAYSPNIKERRDFSCALFDAKGQMVAQAAHIPVHLGSMPCSVQGAIQCFDFSPGDVVILNDPYQGGTHLPDITLINPVFWGGGSSPKLFGFVANRAHHADVGGMSPGSMPVSQEIYQEGIIIPALKIVEAGNWNHSLLALILANVRTPEERAGDLRAQIAANQIGGRRLTEMLAKYGPGPTAAYMQALLHYAERMTREMISDLPDGTYSFSDQMDDDGVDPTPAAIAVSVTIQGDEAVVDFSGTSPQRKGSINAVLSITLSATFFVFRSLMSDDAPFNSGCFRPITVRAPEGSLVNARPPAALAGGNVETSQRITDVLLGALAEACPERIPAASQGTMNNLSLGGWNPESGRPYAYYETIGGGMGARPGKPGMDAVHTHMTNTLNTPVEALEYAYPLRVLRYEIRRGSGGRGRHRGGDGIRRDIQLLSPGQASILSDRRSFPPYGLAGGEPGKTGHNVLIRGEKCTELPGKVNLSLAEGDVISIRTPGGGGYGAPNEEAPP